MPTTTQAYVARTDPSSLKLETITYPDLGPHEVLVDILAVSICHTDVRTIQGNFRLAPPVIPGHEASGYVRSIGSNVTDVKDGDAVVLSYASCGQCRRCLSGKQAYCDELSRLNFSGLRDGDVRAEGVKDAEGSEVNGLFFGQSSMSRVALVRESCCVKVEGATREEMLKFPALSCGVQTGAGAILNVAKPAVGFSVVVFGAGAVGLSAVMAARLMSPSAVILVDNSTAKLQMIPKELLEGVSVVNAAEKPPGDLATEIKALTPGGVGVDVAVDCVGSASVLQTGHACLDSLGMLITVGSGSPDVTLGGITAVQQLAKGATARGTHQGDSVSRVMIPKLIRLWRSGKFPFDKLLSSYGFEGLDKALNDMKAGKIIKPVLVVDGR